MYRQLKKVVYALTEYKLQQNIDAHIDRGWVQASDIKEYHYGLGVLMVWGNNK